nr:hypothetical protein [Candidatus Njordarchaeota archaeon]
MGRGERNDGGRKADPDLEYRKGGTLQHRRIEQPAGWLKQIAYNE